jgi:hypothetical protein
MKSAADQRDFFVRTPNVRRCSLPHGKLAGYQQKMLKVLWKSGKKVRQVVDTTANMFNLRFRITAYALAWVGEFDLAAA